MLPLLISPAVLGVVGFATYRMLKRMEGEDLSRFDAKPDAPFAEGDRNSEGLAAVNAYLVENFIKPAQSATAASGWDAKRERFTQAGLRRTDLEAEYRDDHVEIDGVRVHGRWTLVEGCDPDRRILYLHGGAFTAGNDISHRPITVNLARRTGCAVFTPNYRLMPENSRRDVIEDAQASYRWILGNGPDGPAPVKALAVAGDSAGGNLALMLAQYARDNGLRQAEAVYALSALVDSTASSPTFAENLESDLMLQPLLRSLLKVPRPMLVMGMRKQLGMNPSDPIVSPVFGDLSGLPPTLLQVSSTEMLYGDSLRYAGRARAKGSDVVVQEWSHMPHVFQIFDDLLPEAHAAFDAAADFLRQHGVAT